MPETRSVPLADVLSVTTPHLLSERGLDGVTDLLNWMTGDQLEAWQLRRAADVCAPALIAQHPVLGGLTPPRGGSKPALRVWLSLMIGWHGEFLDVGRVSGWVHQDPVDEFFDRVDLVNLPVAE